MKRMKTFCKYALWIIVFFIFSTIVSDIRPTVRAKAAAPAAAAEASTPNP